MQPFIKVNMRQDSQWFSDWECGYGLQSVRYTFFGLHFRISAIGSWIVGMLHSRPIETFVKRV